METKDDKPEKSDSIPSVHALAFLDKNLKHFSPAVRNTIGLGVLLVFMILSLHSFAPTYIRGRIAVKNSEHGPMEFAKDFLLITGETEIPVDQFGRWTLPVRGFIPVKRKISVYSPSNPGIVFARFDVWGPIPIKSAIAVSEPEVIIHTYRENEVEISMSNEHAPQESLFQLTSLKNDIISSLAQHNLKLIVHLQDIGDVLCEGTGWCGTIGENRRMEGFALTETGLPGNTRVEYMGHLAETGDTPWLQQGTFCGTRGKGLRLEGLAFKLVGDDANSYAIRYQVHLKNLGTSQIFQNGEFAGRRGEARHVEAFRVWIERN